MCNLSIAVNIVNSMVVKRQLFCVFRSVPKCDMGKSTCYLIQSESKKRLMNLEQPTFLSTRQSLFLRSSHVCHASYKTLQSCRKFFKLPPPLVRVLMTRHDVPLRFWLAANSLTSVNMPWQIFVAQHQCNSRLSLMLKFTGE